MNANLKAASDCFIDKSLLECLVVNTLLVVAIFITVTSVFRSHCLTGATEIIEKLNEYAEM